MTPRRFLALGLPLLLVGCPDLFGMKEAHVFERAAGTAGASGSGERDAVRDGGDGSVDSLSAGEGGGAPIGQAAGPSGTGASVDGVGGIAGAVSEAGPWTGPESDPGAGAGSTGGANDKGGAGSSAGAAGSGGAGNSADAAGLGGAGHMGGAGGRSGSPGVGGTTICRSSDAGVSTAFVENNGASCSLPPMPDDSALVTEPALPDPFLSLSGARICGGADWTCRRAEIAAQAQAYELGPKPPKSGSVRLEVTTGKATITVTDGGRSMSFSVGMTLPTLGDAPYPAVIEINGPSLPDVAVTTLGVARVSLADAPIASPSDTSSNKQGAFYTLFGADHPAGAHIAIAWAVSRLMDVLETTTLGTLIDVKHVGVSGCGDSGKEALIAGAFDERIRLTIPRESGTGGAGAWRIAQREHSTNPDLQILADVASGNRYRSSFGQFADSVDRLPFDHHEILGLVAPRGLLVLENGSSAVEGGVSNFETASISHKIWEALGVPDHMGVWQKPLDACAVDGSEVSVLQAYVRKFLLDDDSQSTAVMHSESAFPVDLARWVPWTTPTLP